MLPNVQLKIDAAYGRLYVSGPSMHVATRLPGAAVNARRRSVELSLTLETLRGLRRELDVTKREFASLCTDGVIAWAKAAAESEKRVTEMHEQLAAGWRPELLWRDSRANTIAPDDLDEEEQKATYVDADGARRRWSYRVPYDHQEIMAALGLSLDGCAVMGEVGTGKTRAALEVAQERARVGDLDLIIIAAKKAGVANVWNKEIPNWTPALEPLMLRGKVTKRSSILQDILHERLKPEPGKTHVVLINHDVLRLLEEDILLLCRTKRVGFILDESQKIRNPEAKVTQVAMRIAAAARWRMIMTGSPVIQGEQDVWSQWYVVDLGITFGPNFVQYRREWLNEDPYTFKLSIKDEESQTQIGLRMRRRGYRITKEQGIPGLPPRVPLIETVELTAKQRQAYDDLEETLVAELSQADEGTRVATAANQLTMILRLSQITSGHITDDEGHTYDFEPNPKLHALQELVEENVRNGSIIVWAWYRNDVEKIVNALKDYQPEMIYGGQSDTRRDRAISRFTNKDTRILVANQGSGGTSLNLQVAPLAIYYSQNYNLEDRLQSEGRNHRGGSQIHKQITYIDLIAENTIDEIVLSALKHKKSVADAVVDLRRAIGLEQVKAA